MSKNDSTLFKDKNIHLPRRQFIRMAAAGSAIIAATAPDIATASKIRIISRQRQPAHSGVEEIESLHFKPHTSESRNAHHLSPLSSYKHRLRPRDLTLYVESSGEKLSLTYFESGEYLADALEEVNHLLRDQHNGDVHSIDPELLDQLYQLKGMLGVGKKPYHVLSGYRSPETNAKLHRNTRGVATKSLHMSGKAIDIRIEGTKTRAIRDAALSLAQGGVGYYPHSNFVHIDTGNFRTW